MLFGMQGEIVLNEITAKCKVLLLYMLIIISHYKYRKLVWRQLGSTPGRKEK